MHENDATITSKAAWHLEMSVNLMLQIIGQTDDTSHN